MMPEPLWTMARHTSPSTQRLVPPAKRRRTQLSSNLFQRAPSLRRTQEPIQTKVTFKLRSTAPTSMKDLLLRMEKPREFLIQRLVSTATQISSLVRRLRFSSVLSLMIQTGVHHMQAFLIAEMKKKDPNWGQPHAGLPHCPDFDERMTLTDGKTKGVAYPAVGYNCTSDYQLAEKKDPNWGKAHAGLPHCPDFDERMTLTDGVTKGVAYPAVGYNCTSDYQLA